MEPFADTTAGKVMGRDKNGMLLFAGVPFASPPIGDLRFRAPEPAEPWDGVREAVHFSKVAPQTAQALGGLMAGPPPDWSEDCLYLNVQTPALDGAKRPVIVWIHGGGFLGGTGSIPWYDCAKFLRHGDLVAVTINYRLGALGWMHLSDLDNSYSTSSNNGLLDQIAALEWVHDNIAAFGGDPDNVTIFGESAGGMSVATLMGTPRAKGLFRRAIPQSGAAQHAGTVEAASQITKRMLDSLQVQDIDGLLSVSTERILEAQEHVNLQVLRDQVAGNLEALGLSFTPVVDGEVLHEPPLDAVRSGLSKDVPLLVGTTRDEWNLFGIATPPVNDDETIIRRLNRTGIDAEKMLAVYRLREAEASSAEVWSSMITDRVFRIPAIRLAEAQAAHQPDHTFMYLFEWPSNAFDGRLGACHALEIPFVFDNLDKTGVEFLTGVDAPQSLADDMHGAWINFAQTSDPNGAGLPEWPAYDPGENRATMCFGTPTHLVHDPEPDERNAWEVHL